jgi:catechol 2,3-dioxygenase
MVVKQKETEKQVRFRPRRLGHVNLSFQNFDEAVSFYQDVVGIELVYGKPGKQSAFFTNGNTHHDLGTSGIGTHPPGLGVAGKPIDARHRGIPSLNHTAYEMENEALLVEGWIRSQEAGLQFHGTDHQASHALYTKDPEGNGVEIYADFHKEWWEILNTKNMADETFNISSPWLPGATLPITEPKYHTNPEITRVPGAIFNPRRIAHVALVVDDFEGQISYYTDVVGLDVAFRGPNDSYAVLGGSLSGHDLTIIKATEGQLLGLHHIGFEMDSEAELDEADGRMKAAGIQAVLKIDHPTKRATFLRDPDGLLVEFFVERSGPHSMVCELEPGVALYLV